MTVHLARVNPLLLQVATQAQTVPWYASANGVLALIVATLSLCGTIYTWGWKARKQTDTLDGFGRRMAKAEEALQRSHERDIQWVRSLEQVLESNKQLVAAVAEAKGTSIQCQVDMTDATEKIRDEIKVMVTAIHASDVAAEGRMARVETELRLTRERRT